MVSAWSAQNRVVLGQIKADEIAAKIVEKEPLFRGEHLGQEGDGGIQKKTSPSFGTSLSTCSSPSKERRSASKIGVSAVRRLCRTSHRAAFQAALGRCGARAESRGNTGRFRCRTRRNPGRRTASGSGELRREGGCRGCESCVDGNLGQQGNLGQKRAHAPLAAAFVPVTAAALVRIRSIHSDSGWETGGSRSRLVGRGRG